MTNRITSVFEVFRKEVDELLLVHLVREELIFLQSNKRVRIEQNSWSTSMSSSLVGSVFGGGTIVIAVKYNSGSRISHSYRSTLEECNIEPLAHRRATKCKTFIMNIKQSNPLSNQVKSGLELRTKPYNLRATTDHFTKLTNTDGFGQLVSCKFAGQLL